MAEDGSSLVYGGTPNTGAAQVFAYPKNSDAALERYMRYKRAEQNDDQEEMNNALSGLNNVKPWAADTAYFQKKKQEYLDFVTKGVKNKSYNDPAYIMKKNEMKDAILMEAVNSKWHEKQYEKINNILINQPETLEDVDDVGNQLKDYREKYNPNDRPLDLNIQQLSDADYNKYIKSAFEIPHAIQTTYNVKTNGTKESVMQDTFDENRSMKSANDFLSNDNKYTIGLRHHLRKELLQQNPTLANMPEHDRMVVEDMAMKDYFKEVQKRNFTPKFRESLQNAPSNLVNPAKDITIGGDPIVVSQNAETVSDGKVQTTTTYQPVITFAKPVNLIVPQGKVFDTKTGKMVDLPPSVKKTSIKQTVLAWAAKKDIPWDDKHGRKGVFKKGQEISDDVYNKHKDDPGFANSFEQTHVVPMVFPNVKGKNVSYNVPYDDLKTQIKAGASPIQRETLSKFDVKPDNVKATGKTIGDYPPTQQAAIKLVMKNNKGISEADAIQALIDAKKL